MKHTVRCTFNNPVSLTLSVSSVEPPAVSAAIEISSAPCLYSTIHSPHTLSLVVTASGVYVASGRDAQSDQGSSKGDASVLWPPQDAG